MSTKQQGKQVPAELVDAGLRGWHSALQGLLADREVVTAILKGAQAPALVEALKAVKVIADGEDGKHKSCFNDLLDIAKIAERVLREAGVEGI